jgi:hypothetical protein
MVIERPEKSGSRHFARVEDHDLSMTAPVEMAQFVLGKGRTVRLLAEWCTVSSAVAIQHRVAHAPEQKFNGL